MTTLPFKLAIDPVPGEFLLTVRGSLAAPNREAGRLAHNQVAGSDEAVAMARSFGDLSHAVYVPAEAPASGAGELLIIDYWNSAEGLMKFFANEQVQQGGTMVFKNDRENVVWRTTPGLPHFNLPAPAGKNDRYIGLARGPVKFFRMSPPGEKPSLEAIGVDVWFDAAGMQAIYADPAEMAGFGDLFTARPATSVWQKPTGSWVEW